MTKKGKLIGMKWNFFQYNFSFWKISTSVTIVRAMCMSDESYENSDFHFSSSHKTQSWQGYCNVLVPTKYIMITITARSILILGASCCASLKDVIRAHPSYRNEGKFTKVTRCRCIDKELIFILQWKCQFE